MTAVALDDVLAEVWQALLQGVAQPASPFRTLVLATAAADGTPDQRMVVLRAADPAARRLEAHTDSRSAKYAQLRHCDAVALLGWDPARRLQVRLSGQATLHSGDAAARAAWQALSPLSRGLYRVSRNPGSVLPDPSPNHYSEWTEAEGFAVFSVIAVTIARIETLRLDAHGQQRARFDFDGDVTAAAWLVP